MMRSIPAAACLLTIFTLVSPVTAVAAEDQPAALAPPGQCAEPRTAAGAGTGESFAVVGPISSLFDPRDVAAAPPETGLGQQGPPDARALVRPGACDQPGSGCGAVAPTRPEVVVPPILPGVRPPRVSP